MASFITKNFLDNEGLKAFWKLIKQYVEEYVNNNSNNGKPITWGDITDKPTVYGTAKSSSHKHTASFSDTVGHTHTFSGSKGTTDTVNDHTHSVNVKGSVTSSFSDTVGHTHTFSGSKGTTDTVNDHTHSVNVKGSVTSSFSDTVGHTHGFSGSKGTTDPVADHTHSVNFASQSAGDHQHTFTPAGSVSLSGSLSGGVLTITAGFTGSTLTTISTGAHTHSVSGTSGAAGGHSHDFTPTGSVNNAKAVGTVTVDNETTHTHNVEIAL